MGMMLDSISIVMQTLLACNVRKTRILRFTDETENTTWLADTDRGRFVIRRSLRVRSLASLRCELQFLQAAARKATVPRPIADDHDVPKIARSGGRLFFAFAYVTGRVAPSAADPATLIEIGAILANLHRVHAPNRSRRPWRWMVDLSLARLDSLRHVRPRSVVCPLEREVSRAAQVVRTLATDPFAVLCHNDVHPRNVLVSPAATVLIDFDDAVWAPKEWELASAAAAWTATRRNWQDFPMTLARLVEGYQSNEGKISVARLRRFVPAALAVRVCLARRVCEADILAALREISRGRANVGLI